MRATAQPPHAPQATATTKRRPQTQQQIIKKIKKLLSNLLTNTGKCFIIKTRKGKEREDKKMAREEIKRRIEELENREFFYNMVDRWTEEDRKAVRAIGEEIRNLKKALAVA